ncbi:MAG: right-handed parallel beta-helix repeat-containing protein, partial [Armatimonadetes bacterium]|nr:right-handed parallel beta-helix repeat-containing protein [Armatimonadota bacterium]
PPTVTITDPPGAEVHMAAGQTSAQLAGTATDGESGIASVEVGFTTTGSQTPPGTWYAATYSSTTHVWTYVRQNPTTERIWVKATDRAAKTATTYVTVLIVTVKYVKQNGTGTGSSWELAEDKVAHALTAAPSGTEIWVAQGTYCENISLESGVAVYGGFTAAETYREQRNWATNKTVLDGGDVGSVVTVSYPVTSATIDGFTIAHGRNYYYGGGVYCSSASLTTIANNIIRGNSADNCYGGGLYAYDSTLTVVGNVFVENNAGQGGGIFYVYSSGQIANNTIICNTASYGGGIYLVSSSPALTNNIVAFNTGGGICKSGGSPTLSHNCVYGNTAYQYSGLSPGTGDISADPLIPYMESGDWHIAWGSPCRDAGDDSVVLPTDRDIDNDARRNGPIDIGADETTECWRYYITLSRVATHAPIGTPVKVTACVFDSVEMNQPEAGYEVDVSVDAGEIVSVTRDGTTVTLPSGTQSSYGVTNADGNVDVYITRSSEGYVTVSSTLTSCASRPTSTAQVYFWPVVEVVFVIDATGSMYSTPVISGVLATVAYLRSAGVTLAVGGIAFRDSVVSPVYELSMDVDSFIAWVNSLVPDGGATRMRTPSRP